ncbi:MAG: transposase [Candidatus Anammoximicrobium sp.]|nr:transposase [Candidatus Anammoximicrobium sp.]
MVHPHPAERLGPLKKVARSLREHAPLVMNWLKAREEILAGVLDGLNLKARLSIRKALGFHAFEGIKPLWIINLGIFPNQNSLTNSADKAEK